MTSLATERPGAEPRSLSFYIGSPAASPYLRPRRVSRVWGWVGEVVRICYTYRLVGVCVCVCVGGWVWAVSNVGLTHVGQSDVGHSPDHTHTHTHTPTSLYV